MRSALAKDLSSAANVAQQFGAAATDAAFAPFAIVGVRTPDRTYISNLAPSNGSGHSHSTTGGGGDLRVVRS